MDETTLLLYTGQITKAIRVGWNVVRWADHNGDDSAKMSAHTTLANVFWQRGQIGAAKTQFAIAASLGPLLNFSAFLADTFQLEHGNRSEVVVAELKLAALLDNTTTRPHVRGLILLNQGRLLAVRNRPGAIGLLNSGLKGLRQSKVQDELPRGLLLHAQGLRCVGEFARAEADLHEIISGNTELKLFQVDARLELAEILQLRGQQESARMYLRQARDLSYGLSYDRWLRRIKLLRSQLGD